MFLVEFVFALVISMLCAAALLLSIGQPMRGRRQRIGPLSTFALVLVLFLSTWAGGLWLVPIGPRLWGVAWGSFLAVGLFVALLMAALISAREPAVDEPL